MSNILEEIVERHPLEHSYAEDGRYAWPERWKEAKEAFAALEAKLVTAELGLVVAQNYLARFGPLDESDLPHHFMAIEAVEKALATTQYPRPE